MSVYGVAGRKTRRRSAEPELRLANISSASMSVVDWQALVDNAGPFAPLSELRQYLQSAPPKAHSLPQYHWLKGFLQGRELHEEFASADVKRK